MLFFASSLGPVSWAHFGAPHYSCSHSPCLLCFLGPLRAGAALFLFISSFRCWCCVFSFAVVLAFLSVFCLGPRVFPHPPPNFFIFFSPWCPSRFPFFFHLVLWFLAPVSCAPPPVPPLFCCIMLFPFAPSCCCCLLFIRGRLLPRAVPVCPAVLCAVLFLGVACVLLWCCCPLPLPTAISLSVFSAFCPGRPFFFACSCSLSCPASASGVVRCVVCVLPRCAVVACLCHAVLCGGSLCGLVAHCPALLLAALFLFVLFFFAPCGPCVPCCFVRCCAALLSVVCGAVLVSRCLLRYWAASCCAVVLSCVVARCCALCRASLWWSGLFRSCVVSCFGVPPCAVLCCSFFCGGSVVRCPVSCSSAASSGVALLCPMALVVVCRAVYACVVFGGASCAVLGCTLLACLCPVDL